MGRVDCVNPTVIVQAREALKYSIAKHLYQKLIDRFNDLHELAKPHYDVNEMGRRSLVGLCLGYLNCLKDDETRRGTVQKIAQMLFDRSIGQNMTDTVTGLSALTYLGGETAKAALHLFHERFKGSPLVINKWLDVQASNPSDDALDVMLYLIQHPSFSIENPNNVYSSLLAFATRNTLAFHDRSGAGYRFLADQILKLDKINPMVAARVVNPLTHWRRYETSLSQLMRGELERILEGHEDGTPISDNVREYLIKSLD